MTTSELLQDKNGMWQATVCFGNRCWAGVKFQTKEEAEADRIRMLRIAQEEDSYSKLPHRSGLW